MYILWWRVCWGWDSVCTIGFAIVNNLHNNIRHQGTVTLEFLLHWLLVIRMRKHKNGIANLCEQFCISLYSNVQIWETVTYGQPYD